MANPMTPREALDAIVDVYAIANGDRRMQERVSLLRALVLEWELREALNDETASTDEVSRLLTELNHAEQRIRSFARGQQDAPEWTEWRATYA